MPRCAELLKHVLQSALVYLAAFITYSRFVDNYHHPDDLVAGVIIGSLAALVTARFIAEPSLFGSHVDGETCASVYKPSVYEPVLSKSAYEPLPSTSGFCYTSSSSKGSHRSSSQSVNLTESQIEKTEKQSLLRSSTKEQS